MKPRRPRRTRRRPHFPFRFSLRQAMFVLPNLFTISSIFCGFYAIVLASGEAGPAQLVRATLAIFFGIFFDMADGRVARMTRTQSEFGVQLDSLADLISFGLAPAVIVHRWALAPLGIWGVVVAFVYVACGALRLARFNVLAARSAEDDGGGGRFFVGLPIPLAAGVLVSLVLFHQRTAAALGVRESHVQMLVLVLAYLMVSNVRYRTFKDTRLNLQSVLILTALITAFATVAALIQPSFAILAFFCGYVALGLLEEVVFFRRRRHEAQADPAALASPALHESESQ